MNNFRSMGLPGARNSIQDSTGYSADFGGQQRRTHPHSQNALQLAPGTPMRNAQSFMKSSPGGANYSRGVMMESTESIDYADDSAKDLKPPHSYAQLIGMAILSTPEQQMTLNNIYKWIMANYAFYRFNMSAWQNSIRHNLSLNKAFTKIARRTDEPGKGMKWMIEPTEFENFVSQGMKGCRRPNPIPGTQSTFGSPNSPAHLMRQGVNGVKKDEEITPPMNAYRPSYPAPMEAYTPDRGSKRAPDGGVGLGINGDGPEYDYQTRSTPRNGLTAIANAAGSPPALFVNEEPRAGTLDTPFPFRPTQRLAPPSTLKRPSDFIQFSSPAPFWKMEGLAGSTPFKPYDLSPLKTPFSGFKKEGTEDKKEVDAETNVDEKEAKVKEASQESEPKLKGSPIINSSSPPRPNSSGKALEGSPTMSRPATAVAKTLSQLAAASKEASPVETDIDGSATESQEKASTTTSAAPTQATSATASGLTNTQTSTASMLKSYNSQPVSNHSVSYSYTTSNGPTQNGFHDDGEEDGIDLAK
jgi:forkhead protein FKH